MKKNRGLPGREAIRDGKGREGGTLLHPGAVAAGEVAPADGLVLGGLHVAPEGYADGLAPDAGHAAAGVAAVAPAVRIRGEGAALQLGGEVFLMHPSLGGADDVAAVVEHEGKGVRVAEVVEGGDFVAATAGVVDGGVGLVRGVHEDELHLALGGLLANVGDVVLAVLTATADVGGAVDNPDDVGGGVLLLQLIDADGGAADEVCPPVVMGVRAAEFLPRLEGNTAGKHNIHRRGGVHHGGQQGCHHQLLQIHAR